MKVLTNHMGYSAKAPKKAVLVGDNSAQAPLWQLLDEKGGSVAQGQAVPFGEVARWNKGFFWSIDFSTVQAPGEYRLQVKCDGQEACSEPFEISEKLLTMRMLSAVGYYFKAQRDSGEWEYSDKNLAFAGEREGRFDLHGAWYDATGDLGIHLSHLSHSTIHNPQQVPLAAYAFFKAFECMEASGNEEYHILKRRMLDEGTFGADYLVRSWAPSGSFFRSIHRCGSFGQAEREIGFEYHRSSSQFSDKAATADEEQVRDENYETSLRSGGGMSIAALAIAARYPYPGTDYSVEKYLEVAQQAWAYLKENNEKYANDGAWNLIDEYCALMACVELYLSTQKPEYLADAHEMASRIENRTEVTGEGMRRLCVQPGDPYYHASDEGLPVVALLQYAAAETDGEKAAAARDCAESLMRWKAQVTDRQANPFGYPKFEHLENGELVDKFFFPHTTTVAPWWQGDNARIASLSAAAAMTAEATADEALANRMRAMAQDPLNWIMGLNPFDACMIEGYGRNNIQYFFNGRYDFLNCPGGIVNGITSGLQDEQGIEFVTKPGGEIIDNWRWAEQWIPHAGWYIWAMAMKKE